MRKSSACVLGAMFVLFLGGCENKGKQKRLALEKEIAEAQASIAENEAGFTAAMATAATLPDGKGGCPYASPPDSDDPGNVANMEKYAVAAMIDGSSGVVVSKPTDAVAPKVKRMKETLAQLPDSMKNAALSVDDARKRVAALDPKTYWTWDLVVVEEAATPGGAVDPGKGTFEGRAAVGRSYAYDYAKKKIVCVGRFEAENAKRIGYTDRPGGIAGYGAVGRDLDAQALRKGRQALEGLP